jgi:AmmeMemoRadiSam system protein B
MRFFVGILFVCLFGKNFSQTMKLRPLADTIGFASTSQQMDAVMERIGKLQSEILKKKQTEGGITNKTIWKTVIAPHDDYTYAGYLYPLALQNIKAKTVILFGVAHKAKNLKLENQFIFDSYTHWRGPYGNVKVSSLREDIISELAKANFIGKTIYQVNDSMQKIEHSLEAEIPFLQYFNHNIEIVPILVPYMSYGTMTEYSGPLAEAIKTSLEKNNLKWGPDVAIVISADAVHYGDEDWGGRNFAFYGADTAGYKKAVKHEYTLMDSCFSGVLQQEKILRFTDYTLQEENYKEYKWTWCGRYSVPMGLLTAFDLSTIMPMKPLEGKVLGYETSLSNKPIPVSDLGTMGVTAKANIRHWVGYPAIGFK